MTRFMSHIVFAITLLHLLWINSVKSKTMSEKQIDAYITGIVRKFPNLTMERSESSKRRPKLPSDWNKRKSFARCDATYSLVREGFVVFDLSSEQECYMAFVGSKAEGEVCTTSIVCNTVLDFQGAPCNQKFLRISDGTQGLLEACDTYDFRLRPRQPRNGGADLYIEYKGSSKNTRCVATCIEGNFQGSVSRIPRMRYGVFPSHGSCVCGKRMDIGRVVGGTTAKKFEFPWLGTITFKFPSRERINACGATLISDSYALSAAHCFQRGFTAESFSILFHAHVMDKWTPQLLSLTGVSEQEAKRRVPGWDLPKETDQTENSIRVDVEAILLHPLFNAKTFDYDVALLKLKPKIDFQQGKITPICLPLVNEKLSYKDGDNMVLAGWGQIDENFHVPPRLLQKLDVPFTNYQKCLQYTYPSKRHICAGHLSGGKDGCQGDSGGPLIYKFNPNNNQYLLSGIVSAGVGCARKNSLGVYTDVREIVQWVYSYAADGRSKWCKR